MKKKKSEYFVIPENEISDGSDANDECLAGDDIDVLWKNLANLTSITDDDPIEVFKGFIEILMKSENDDLFNRIMNQTIGRITNDYHKPIAIEETIDENYDAIVNAAGDEKGFWNELLEKGKNWKCVWFTGKQCDCVDCEGKSIRDVVRVYVKLFLDMQDDDFIQKIESDIDEIDDNSPLTVRIDHVIKRHKYDIEKKRKCNQM